MEFEVREYKDYASKAWYFIASTTCIEGVQYHLWKDGTMQKSTGYSEGGYSFEGALGYWSSREEAQQFLNSWLPQKDWITKDQVVESANLSDECAHACSINHWKQIVLASDEEYRAAYCKGFVNKHADFCSLCERHLCKCSVCTLKDTMCGGGCVPEWSKARYGGKKEQIAMLNKLIETYNKHFGEKKMDTNLDARIEQNRRDQEKLKEEEQRLLKEKKDKEKYVFQKGDVVVNDGGQKRIIVRTDQGKINSIDSSGNWQASQQTTFEEYSYKKIGELKDLLK